LTATSTGQTTRTAGSPRSSSPKPPWLSKQQLTLAYIRKDRLTFFSSNSSYSALRRDGPPSLYICAHLLSPPIQPQIDLPVSPQSLVLLTVPKRDDGALTEVLYGDLWLAHSSPESESPAVHAVTRVAHIEMAMARKPSTSGSNPSVAGGVLVLVAA
jgi:hypothetical protein